MHVCQPREMEYGLDWSRCTSCGQTWRVTEDDYGRVKYLIVKRGR